MVFIKELKDKTKMIIMRYSIFILLFVLFTFLIIDLEAQITQNNVDSLGLKQGMWREFKVPTNLVTEEIGIKVPEGTSEYYYLTKDKDRKFFPIIECVGEYKNGLKTGIWLDYYGDGTKKSQIEYKEGVPTGKCRMFWGTGVLKEKFTINSHDSIPVTFYDFNGDLLMEKIVSKKGMIRAIYEN